MLARLLKRPHHLRTYAMKEAKSLLLHSGFRVRESAHYQMAPTLSGSSSGHRWLRPLSRLLWTLNPLLERMWPICRTAANLYLVGEKCQAITWTAAEGRNPSAQRAA
jgi:hypothetical protein